MGMMIFHKILKNLPLILNLGKDNIILNIKMLIFGLFKKKEKHLQLGMNENL
jgi:hypothetical protein